MSLNSPFLSIVIPTYNICEVTYLQFLNEISYQCSQHAYLAEIIIVDDASNNIEKLECTLQSLEFKDTVKLFKLKSNKGQDYTTAFGILHSTAPIIITIDDDAEYLASDIPKMINAMNELQADLIYGIRSSEKKNLIRKLSSKLFYYILKYFGYERVSSFRCLKAEYKNIIDEHINDQYFILDKVLFNQVKNIKSIIVDFNPLPGSRYTVFKLFKRAFDFVRYQSENK